jgi:putative ABC transport system substrate-binding protein
MKTFCSPWSVVNKRVFVFALCAVLPALCGSGGAQEASKVPRVGFLSGGSPSANVEGFRQGLKDFGYVEGKTILVEYRYAEGKFDRLPELAAELVNLKVDVMVTGGANPARAAKSATTAIPIVMAAAADAVAMGLVSNLARPEGNVTGSTRVERDLIGKRIELAKETFPRAARIAVLWHLGMGTKLSLKEYEAAIKVLGMTFQSLQVQAPTDFERVFQKASRERSDVVMVDSNGFTNSHRKPIVELSAQHRLPTICETTLFVEAGGLMSYSPSGPELYRRSVYFVDRILKGAKPAELPIEQPKKFELAINLKTAKQIGVTIPQWVLVKADRVIR